jgi:YbbR domain-containing protein
VSVTVTAPGVSVAGAATVVVKSAAGKTITVKATVKAGKASVSLPKLKAGSYKVSVNFAGTSTVRSSVSAAVGLRVR